MRTRLASILMAALAVGAGEASAQASKAAPPTAGALPLQHAPAPTRSAISENDLITRVYILAADSMLGREAGGPGNVKATDYLAAEARRLGLKPAGDKGGYFQVVPLVFRSADTTSSLTAGGSRLALRADYVAIPGVPAFPFGWGFETAGAKTIYGGTFGDTAALRPGQFAGKIVVLGPRMAGGRPNFMFWMVPGWEHYRGAAGIAVATLDISPAWMIPEALKPYPTLADAGVAGKLPGGIVISAAVAQRLFGKALSELKPGDEGAALSGAVRFTDRRPPFPARNVVAVLPGRDRKLAAEYVAVGAHSDHVGIERPIPHDSLEAFNRVMRPGGERGARTPTPEQWTRIVAVRDSLRAIWPERMDSVDNGAEDNASGTAAVLEVAERLVAGPRPKRSVLFVWHTAEELRYLGARWFTDNPTVPRDSIVAQINLDGYGHRVGGTSDVRGDLAVIGAGRLSGAFGRLVDAVAAKDGVTLDRRFDAAGEENQLYCRSDHFLYARYGIPAVFFTSWMYPAYHQVTDEAQYLDYPRMARLTRFAADLALMTADLAQRPALDPGHVIDPDAGCVQ